MRRGIFQCIICGLAAVWTLAARADESVVNSPHDLSSHSPNRIRAVNEDQVCIFCHTPHNADPRAPLWNRAIDTGTTYITYSSPTFEPGVAPQPDGASKLCLSCHDGTIALGQVRSRSEVIPVSGGPNLKPGQAGYLGTDLSGMHPISFLYDDALAIQNNAAGDVPLQLPSTLSDPDVKLDKQGKIQCTTCHDPHDDSNYDPGVVPHFWAKPTWSGVCLTCHDF